MEHVIKSMDFSVKYISVIFKWLSVERKQGAIELMGHISQKEQFLSHQLLKEFTEHIDTDIREPFLKHLRTMTEKRLEAVNKLLGEVK